MGEAPDSGRLRCGQCKSDLHPADVLVSSLEARCRHCGWTFGGAGTPYRRGALPEPRSAPPEDEEERHLVPRPARMRVLEAPVPAIVYRVPGDRALGVALGIMALTLIAAVIALGAGQAIEPGLVLLLLATPPLVYLALAKLFNKRHIELRGPYLQARQRPFPLPFGPMVPRRDIGQLYVRQQAVQQGPRRYEVVAQHGSEATVIASAIDNPIEALFIEQEIERRLAIEDVPVPGEYRFLAKKRGR